MSTRWTVKDWTIKELLELYTTSRLPVDIMLVHVPIEQATCGDYRVVIPGGHTGDIETERVRLSQYWIRGHRLFAGYGNASRALVIGTESSGRDDKIGQGRRDQ